jgi:hypothetical protein
MTLINETHVRGANKEFQFKHRVKGENQIFTIGAINKDNAQRKAWQAVSKAYKAIKKQKQIAAVA